MKPTSIMKTTLVIAIAAATLSCGESKKERAQRESDEADRQTLLEYQRQDNIQRQRDRDQRTLETGVQVLDVLTR
jgi:hypothetical protein